MVFRDWLPVVLLLLEVVLTTGEWVVVEAATVATVEV